MPVPAAERSVRDAARDAARKKSAPSFVVSASPATQTVAPGGSAAYSLSIYQRKYRGSVRMRIVSPLPRGVKASITPNPTSGTRSRLRLSTTAATRSATFRVRVRAYRSKPSPPRSASRSASAMRRWRRATSGRRRFTRTVRLVVRAAAPAQPIPVGAIRPAPLAPGASVPVDVWITNTTGSALSVKALSMSIARIDAPRASGARGCEPADFSIEQFSGSTFAIPPRATRRLSEAGVPQAHWPMLKMLDRPTNQDGCKGADLQLAFSVTGTGGS